LGNNLENFQLHRFTIKENIAKSFRSYFFTLTVDVFLFRQIYFINTFLYKRDAFVHSVKGIALHHIVPLIIDFRHVINALAYLTCSSDKGTV